VTKSATKALRCGHCRERFKKSAKGRPPRFCGAACRQAAYLARKVNRVRPVQLLADDLAHMRVQAWLRNEIWNILREVGLVTDPKPPPAPQPRRAKPPLHVVRRNSPGE
jgi:hypothetical protein